MTWIIAHIEKISDAWFRIIVGSSVQLTIFLSVIGIIAFIFRKKSARFLYFLWLIGLFRVFLPTNFDFLFKHASVNTIKPEFIPTIQIQQIFLISASETTNQINMRDYLFLFWFAGMMIFMIYWLFNYFRFRRMIEHETQPFVLSGSLKEIVENSRAEILTGKFIATPFVRGLFRPKIYFPENASRWPHRELKAILFHELAHIQCKDLILIVIQNVVQMIYFFHPLVWLANMQIFRYREKARDDMAIEKMGGNALAYGKYLLTSMDNAMEWQPIYSTRHYFLQSKSFLYQRFEYIINRKEKIMNRLTNLQKGVLAGCLILGLVLTVFQSNIRSQTNVEENPRIKTIDVRNQQVKLAKKQEVINGRKITFETFDKPPEPVGGFSAIQQKLIYPADARKAGKQGRVLVYCHIGSDGKINDAFIGHSTVHDSSCETAALKAVKSVVWKPAIKQDKPIATWIVVPLSFTLHSQNEIGKTKNEVLPPPVLSPQDSNNVVFVAYDEPPFPQGGMGAIQKNEVPPPPPVLSPQDSNNVVFFAYDKPPFPQGGFAAIQRNLYYPAIARKSGIEGTVIIYAFINEKGEVERTKVIKPLDNAECNEAAIQAIKSVKWEPAKQKDKNVGVWISVPVKFTLSKGKKGATAEMKEVEFKLLKIEQDLEQKEKLLQKKQNEKAAKELKNLREELKNIRKKLKEKNEELQKLDKSIKELKKESRLDIPVETNDKTSAAAKTNDEIVFVPYDKPPKPIGGFERIQRNLYYPEIAQKAGIEGTVIVHAQINTDGEVIRTKVAKPLGNSECNNAAMEAVKSVKWEPAIQRDKPVTTWVSVPVKFKLK